MLTFWMLPQSKNRPHSPIIGKFFVFVGLVFISEVDYYGGL